MMVFTCEIVLFIWIFVSNNLRNHTNNQKKMTAAANTYHYVNVVHVHIALVTRKILRKLAADARRAFLLTYD